MVRFVPAGQQNLIPFQVLARIIHLSVDAVLVSTVIAGITRSSGLQCSPLSFWPSRLTFLRVKVDNIENKDIRNAVNKYLNIGEWVIDEGVAFMSKTSYFERKRWFRRGLWPGGRSPLVCYPLQCTDVSFQATFKWETCVCCCNPSSRFIINIYFGISSKHLMGFFLQLTQYRPFWKGPSPLFPLAIILFDQISNWSKNCIY